MQAGSLRFIAMISVLTVCFGGSVRAQGETAMNNKFEVVEATIADIHDAIKAKKITATDLVNMYLARIKAYNGTCVEQAAGHSWTRFSHFACWQINALMTLNLRPAARKKWGFDDRKARSMTDAVDNDSKMPDALEVAASLDEQFAERANWWGRCMASCSV